MGVRKIVLYPDPILRQKANPVSKFHERLHRLIDDMFETMYDANGVGLAAPQVGILKRVFVVDVYGEQVAIVNPQIVEKSGEQTEPYEGCLSIPGLLGEVTRAESIRITGQDRWGKPMEMKAEGYLARAIQHEIDHLNGVLFIDHANQVFRPEEVEEK